jgi:hypothetical protein
MWVGEDVPELIYCLAIGPRLIGNHALNRSLSGYDAESGVAGGIGHQAEWYAAWGYAIFDRCREHLPT